MNDMLYIHTHTFIFMYIFYAMINIYDDIV